ncbi:MAG: Uma2 family endonuclease [Polyangiales bacterium]
MGDAAEALPDFDALYHQIEALPQGVTGEILDPGALRTMSRPARAHRYTARRLGSVLSGVDRNLGGVGWWIEVEAEVRFGPRLLVPDLAGWRADRVPVFPDESPITLCPDWACEVLSPTTARDDRLKKLPRYIAEGVAHVWLVDPEQRFVEVFAALDGRPLLIASGDTDATAALPPFDGVFDLARWWLPTPEGGSAGAEGE